MVWAKVKGKIFFEVFHVCPFCGREILEEIVQETKDPHSQPIFIHHTQKLSIHMATAHNIRLIKRTDYEDRFNEYECPMCGRTRLGYYFALKHHLLHYNKTIYSDLREVSKELIEKRKEEKPRKIRRKDLIKLIEEEPESLKEVMEVLDRLKFEMDSYCRNCLYYAEKAKCRGCLFDKLLHFIEKVAKGLK